MKDDEVKQPLKLFIFYDFLYNYTSGMACVIAESEEHAISILESKYFTKEISNNKLTNVQLCDLDFTNKYLNTYDKKSYKVEVRELNEPCGYYMYGGS